MDRLTLAFIIAIVAWLPFQDFSVALLLRSGVPVPLLKVVLILKDLAAVVLFLLLLARAVGQKKDGAGKLYPTDLLIIFFTLITGIYSAWGLIREYDIAAVITGARNCVLPAMLYFIGRALEPSSENIGRLVTALVAVSIIVSGFGLFEYFLLPAEIWGAIGIGYVENTVRGISGDAVGAVYMNMYGMLGRRLVSFFGNPLFLSYFSIPLVSIFLYSFFIRGKEGMVLIRLASALSFVTLLLAVSRGVIVSVGIAVFAVSILFHRRSLLPMVVFGSVLAFLLRDTLIEVVTGITSLNDASAYAHHHSTLRGLELVLDAPFGNGVGSYSFGLSSDFLANENAYLTLAYQIGVFGVFSFLAALLGSAFNLARFGAKLSDGKSREKIFLLGIGTAAIAYFFTGFASDLFLTFKGGGHFWLLFGVAVSLRHWLKERDTQTQLSATVGEDKPCELELTRS